MVIFEPEERGNQGVVGLDVALQQGGVNNEEGLLLQLYCLHTLNHRQVA